MNNKDIKTSIDYAIDFTNVTADQLEKQRRTNSDMEVYAVQIIKGYLTLSLTFQQLEEMVITSGDIEPSLSRIKAQAREKSK